MKPTSSTVPNSDLIRQCVSSGFYFEQLMCVHNKQQFVYIEVDAMQPTGLYDSSDTRINESKKNFEYYYEKYGLYKGGILVTQDEYDDNAAFINENWVELGSDVELRVRYITPYNFIIAAQDSPINNNKFDMKLESIMNDLLDNRTDIEYLAKEVLQLPIKNF